MTDILKFSKIKNIRDLGYKKTRNGASIATGRLYRSANPCFASKPDIRKLKTLNLDIIIDFRGSDEKKDEENAFRSLFPCEAQPVKAGDLSPAEYIPVMQRSTVKDMKNLMNALYESFPVDFQQQFGTLMKNAEDNKTLMFHCTAGKDRTGFASALLLSALGVDMDIIKEDYMLSNIYFAPVAKQIAAEMKEHGISSEVSEPLLTVTPHYLDSAFHVIQQKFNGVENFIGDILQIDIGKLRENYLLKG
jgi:Protein tyrosine/serine phosphatase